MSLLRIGTIWRKGVREAEISFVRKQFDRLRLYDPHWRITSFSSTRERGLPAPFPLSKYILPSEDDKSNIIEFDIDQRKRLLIPCLEYFIRCYGVSVEVKRILATYRWEEAKNRLLKPIDDIIAQGSWPIRLGNNIYKNDAVFLAHVAHSEYTLRVAKSIYAQAEAAFTSSNRNERSAYVKASPGFVGPAQLKVDGFWLGDGKTFLGLRIVGSSEPTGNPVVNAQSVTTNDDVHEGRRSGFSVPIMVRLPPIVDLTDDDEPDHESASVKIESDSMEILGARRVVIDRKEAVLRGLVRRRRAAEGEVGGGYSTGERYGSRRGVGQVTIQTRESLESLGVLRDMWNALCYVHRALPNVVQSVGWYTYSGGIQYEGEPRLIPLNRRCRQIAAD